MIIPKAVLCSGRHIRARFSRPLRVPLSCAEEPQSAASTTHRVRSGAVAAGAYQLAVAGPRCWCSRRPTLRPGHRDADVQSSRKPPAGAGPVKALGSTATVMADWKSRRAIPPCARRLSLVAARMLGGRTIMGPHFARIVPYDFSRRPATAWSPTGPELRRPSPLPTRPRCLGHLWDNTGSRTRPARRGVCCRLPGPPLECFHEGLQAARYSVIPAHRAVLTRQDAPHCLASCIRQ